MNCTSQDIFFDTFWKKCLYFCLFLTGVKVFVQLLLIVMRGQREIG